jgi:hypothetical protein
LGAQTHSWNTRYNTARHPSISSGQIQ